MNSIKERQEEEKTRVAIEAIRGQKTANEIASDDHRPSLVAYYDEDFE